MNTIVRLTLCWLLLGSISTNTYALDFYVSPNGKADWSGQLAEPNTDGSDGPLDSLQVALDRVSDLRNANRLSDESVRIIIRGGTYRLTSPVLIEPKHSGSIKNPLIIEAYPGEHPILSGGVPITGWKRGENNKWTAPHGGAYFRQLFSIRGRHRRARTPNDDFFHVSGRVAADKTDAINNRSFIFDGDDIHDWKDPDIDVVIVHSWETSRLPISSVDGERRIVEFAGSAYWPFTSWDERQRYYVENSADSLDEAGEWRLDRSSKQVDYIAARGDDPNTLSTTVPQIEQLLLLKGNASDGKFVEHISISGISFQHADWARPETGISNPQAAVSVSGAVEMHGARHIDFTDCEIAHVGGYAMRVQSGSKDIRIEQNHFHDLGAGGIGIGDTTIAKSEAEATARVTLHNNYLHDGGHVCESGVGVWIAQSSDDTISHNEISDFGYTGVSIGWTWGYGESGSQRNIVEYNHIHHIGTGILSDMGAIYTLGFSAGSILRNNHIHHITSYHYGGWGIYPDEGTSHLLVENNVVHHTKTGGFHQHYGKENLIRNNIFAFAQEGQIIRSREEEHRSFRFERNIIWFDEGYLLGSNWGEGHFYMDYNLYGSPTSVVDFKGMTLDEWRAKHDMDHHSIVDDPLFLDAAAGDYRLAPDSPVYGLGFTAIDSSEIGLIGSAEWRALPSRYTTHRQVWPKASEALTLNEDFESYSPGQTIPYGTSYGLTDGAMIAVTDEKAASGKNSVRFTDAPGLSQAFNPHYYFDPGWRSGDIMGSFDLMIEPGEIFYHEWRTDGDNYHAGPSIWVDGEGNMKIGEGNVATIPQNEWVHFEIRAKLGRQADGKYSVAITLPSGERKEFRDIAGSPNFHSLRWMGFCSQANDTKSFWLDNLRVGPVEN